MRAESSRTGVPLLVIVAFTLATTAACSGSSPTAPSSSGDSGVTLPSLDTMLADKVLGNAAAQLTMIDYSSLACPHCASFHADTLPQIKSAYIDPGTVKVVFKDFPLSDGADLSAAMVARCSGDRFFTVVDLLYKSQATWAGSSNVTAALKNAVASSGMSGAEVDACVARSDLRTGIQAMRTEGYNTYGVTGTPTFIVKGQSDQRIIVGAWPFSTFDAKFKELLPSG